VRARGRAASLVDLGHPVFLAFEFAKTRVSASQDKDVFYSKEPFRCRETSLSQ